MVFYYRNRKVTNTQINPHTIISSPNSSCSSCLVRVWSLCPCVYWRPGDVLLLMKGHGMCVLILVSFTVKNILDDDSTSSVPQRVDAFALHFLTLPLDLSRVTLRCQVHCILQVHLHVSFMLPDSPLSIFSLHFYWAFQTPVFSVFPTKTLTLSYQNPLSISWCSLCRSPVPTSPTASRLCHLDFWCREVKTAAQCVAFFLSSFHFFLSPDTHCLRLSERWMSLAPWKIFS